MYLVTWDQCSNPVRTKLGAVKNFTIHKETDSAALLREIKGILYEYGGHPNPYLALDDVKTKFYSYSKQEKESKTLRFNTFKTLVEVVEHYVDNIVNNDALVNLEIDKVHAKQDVNTVQADKLTTFAPMSRKKALDITFLNRCDMSRYRVLIDNLDNQYSVGTDQYPTNFPSVLKVISSYIHPNAIFLNCARCRRANEEED